MYLSAEHRFVYMAPKKTGSTSMRTVLTDHYNVMLWRDYQFTHIETDVISPDWRSEGPDWKHVCHLPQEFADFFVFATVRNPYTLEQSRFLHDVRHGYVPDNFGRFIRRLVDAHEPPTLARKLHQIPDYTPPVGCVEFALSAFVRLEHLDEDFAKLPFSKSNLVFPRLHAARIKAPGYTRRLAEIVKVAYQDDFNTFGYDPDSWPHHDNSCVIPLV